jgi:serine/threonine protein kinase
LFAIKTRPSTEKEAFITEQDKKKIMVTDSNRLVGQTLGACVLERLIGRGGMGAVYLARQLRPRRMVAVKVLLPVSELDEKAQADFLTRFRHEADAIAALDHINIMPIYEYGEQDQLAYLVMPYVAGGTLRQIFAERHTLTLNEALPIIEQAADALDYAHQRRIIHRDIKPANILFHADGRLLLADFGLAKVLSDTTKVMAIVTPEQQNCETLKPESRVSLSLSGGEIIGTPEYLSPEQALGQAVDGRTDIYSLGIVLYQMLVGQVPFAGVTPLAVAVQHTKALPPSMAASVSGIPARVEAVVMRALAKQPSQRYATAGDFARALRSAIQYDDPVRKAGGNSAVKGYALSSHVLQNNDTVPEMEQVVTAEPLIVEQPPPLEIHQEIYSAPTEPSFRPKRSGRMRRPILIALCLLLILCLGIGGVFALLMPKAAPQAVVPVRVHVQSTATESPVPTRTVQNISLPALVQVGKLLYASHLLSASCEHVAGSWRADAGANIHCNSDSTELTTEQTSLANLFLKTFTHTQQSAIPDNYVLQVEVTLSSSQGNFGLLFRNGPQGQAYAFLISPDGTWDVFTYSSATGLLIPLATGPISDSLQGQFTLDIVVDGDTFDFYLNGDYQGRAISPLYTSGDVGFAVSAGADIFLKNLAIYALPTP